MGEGIVRKSSDYRRFIAVGQRCVSNSGLEFDVIEQQADGSNLIKFIKSGNYQITSYYGLGAKGNIRDYSTEKIKGIGYAIGTKEQPILPKGNIWARWQSMLARCYGKDKIGRYNAYQKVTVCTEWHEYNRYKKWYQESLQEILSYAQFNESMLCVDKDLFSDNGDKVYSPLTCCLIPMQINTAIIGLKWKNGYPSGLNKSRVPILRKRITQYRGKIPERIIAQLQKIIDLIEERKCTDGEKMRERMKTLKITRRHFAKMLGVSTVTLSGWLNGKSFMPNKFIPVASIAFAAAEWNIQKQRDNKLKNHDLQILHRIFDACPNLISHKESRKSTASQSTVEPKEMLRIKEILKDKGVGVSELADRLGVSRQALSKQIQGKMLVETAVKIASALDVPLWELFASKEDVIGNDASGNKTTITCPHCGKPIAIRIEIE